MLSKKIDFIMYPLINQIEKHYSLCYYLKKLIYKNKNLFFVLKIDISA